MNWALSSENPPLITLLCYNRVFFCREYLGDFLDIRTYIIKSYPTPAYQVFQMESHQ